MAKQSSHGILMVVSGPSGSGKTTIIKRLLEEEGETFHFSVSCTTRPRRENEVHGKDYFFLTEPEYQCMVNNEMFMEHATVHGQGYGTLWSRVRDNLGVKNVILDIDIQGFDQVRRFKHEGRSVPMVSIFINPVTVETVIKRLGSREGGLNNREVRIANAKIELERAKDFDFQIRNPDGADIGDVYASFKQVLFHHGRGNG